MQKSEQTSEVLLQLYKLTSVYTKQLQERYYYQYRGDVQDLASEIFTQFITPKGRKGQPKETLLDKFDPTTTSLPYLVKVCVGRKLIDFSRSNPVEHVSIDSLVEEYGDMISEAFQLSTTSEDFSSLLSDKRFLAKLVRGFSHLDEDRRNSFFFDLYDKDSPLVKHLKPSIRTVHGCPIQQVTDKSAVFVYNSNLYTASIADGHIRGKESPLSFTADELTTLRSWVGYHSQARPELFLEYVAA